jgi:hypothetical protein
MTEPAHETRDLPPRGILLALAGIFVLIALAGIGVTGLLHALSPPPAPDALPAPRREGPPLLVAPADELAAVEARGRARLGGWDWLDRAAGVAHIPIERAMALVAERGWPDDARPGP